LKIEDLFAVHGESSVVVRNPSVESACHGIKSGMDKEKFKQACSKILKAKKSEKKR
jgi:hypothetical protein